MSEVYQKPSAKRKGAWTIGYGRCLVADELASAMLWHHKIECIDFSNGRCFIFFPVYFATFLRTDGLTDIDQWGTNLMFADTLEDVFRQNN